MPCASLKRGALEAKLAFVPCVSDRVGIGRSLKEGRDGFIPTVRVVLIVFVLDGAFAEYGGSVVTVLKVSDRANEWIEEASSSWPPSFGSVGIRWAGPSSWPFLMARSSSFLRLASCFSKAFLTFFPTILSRRASIFLRQYFERLPSDLGM